MDDARATPTRRQAVTILGAGAVGAWVAPQILSVPAASAATIAPVTPPDFLAVGFSAAIARGSAAGATWELAPIVTPPGSPALASVVRAGASAWIIAVSSATTPEVWRTVDDGASFTKATTPPASTENPSLATGGGLTLLASRAGPISRSVDQGDTWTPMPVLATGIAASDIAYDGQWAAVSTIGTVYLTNDPNIGWGVPPGFVAPSFGQTLRCIGINGDTIVAAGDLTSMRRSADGGATWTTPAVTGAGGNVRAITSFGTNWVAVGDAGAAYVSTDDGATWTTAPGLSAGNSFRGVAGIAAAPDPIFVATGPGGPQAYRSTNGGASWSVIPPVLGNLIDVAS